MLYKKQNSYCEPFASILNYMIPFRQRLIANHSHFSYTNTYIFIEKGVRFYENDQAKKSHY